MLAAARRTLRSLLRTPTGNVYSGAKASAYDAHRHSKGPGYQAETDAVGTLLETIDAKSVLDVPFGTGRFLHHYKQHGVAVAGLDISADMLESARAMLGDSLDGCELRVGNALRLPYEDASFDLIVCVRFLGTVISYRDAKRVLAEFARVSRRHLIVSLTERKDHVRRWRRPRERHRMYGQFYAGELAEFFLAAGFTPQRKILCSEFEDRASYMWLLAK